MFKTILVAIDASDQRRAVLLQAAEISTRLGADLHVVTARDFAQHWELNLADPVPEIFATLEAEVAHLLEDARHQLEKTGIACRTHAPEGAAAEQIALLAGRIGADLIVIGHHHLSWLGRLVENSVGWDLVARAPCSIMIVLERGAPI
jgi:nucleotide-binding universal stress UspA family protein